MSRLGKDKASAKYIFLLITLLFLVPLALAWILTAHRKPLTEHTINYGHLILPPFPIAVLNIYNNHNQLLDNEPLIDTHEKHLPIQLTTNGKWLLLYFYPNQCNSDCQKYLYYMHQIRIALGKDKNRLECAILTYKNNTASVGLDQFLEQKFASTLHLKTDKKEYKSIISKRVKTTYATKAGIFYIVDPIGNVLMVYEPNTDPTNIYKDIKRLLKVSQIG